MIEHYVDLRRKVIWGDACVIFLYMPVHITVLGCSESVLGVYGCGTATATPLVGRPVKDPTDGVDGEVIESCCLC